MHPDTLSRHLAELGEVLGGRPDAPNCGGILEWDQPPPDKVIRNSLPKSVHYMADGSQSVQGFNVYFWRSAEWVRANGHDPAPFEDARDAQTAARHQAEAALEQAPERLELPSKSASASSVDFRRVPSDVGTGYPADKKLQALTKGDGRPGKVSGQGRTGRSGGPRAASVPPPPKDQPP